MIPGIPESPGPGSGVPPGPEPAPATPGPATPHGAAAWPAPGPTASVGWGDWLSSDPGTRAARKAERRARREARRAERVMGGSFWGVLLMIVGAGILASELIPSFDWNLAWPAILIAFGVLLVLASIRRAPPDR